MLSQTGRQMIHSHRENITQSECLREMHNLSLQSQRKTWLPIGQTKILYAQNEGFEYGSKALLMLARPKRIQTWKRGLCCIKCIKLNICMTSFTTNRNSITQPK
uniref:Uncharacterized protein n=1 Tax=Bionectria ochroleuca TaxID=29856 RepID=A0A0B7KKG7_BIOOC